MGNFLFQAACAIGYAARHQLEFTLPDTTTNPKHNPIYLQHLVKPGWRPTDKDQLVVEGTHAYQELPFREEWRDCNIILDGYWQTEKYFKEHRQLVLDLFNFFWAPLEGFVSVHVRRGDYLKLRKKHPYIGREWIETAMSQFPGYHFVFFSDDIPWCQQVFGKRKDVSFETGNEVQDLQRMSCCEHHICSASTFSWWGAWLNRNPKKKIFIPKDWFVPGHGGLDTSDIVPLEWNKI